LFKKATRLEEGRRKTAEAGQVINLL